MTKQKSTKRALLMSALALLVCVSMLIGSTFAWFTDSVTSSGNIIKSGTLDVTMEWKDATTNGAQKTYKDASAGAIFNYDLWEPGYVEAKNIKISNVGTLALKYNLNIAANGEVSELADVIDVYFAEGEYTLTSRAMTELTKVGTLSDILKGMPANMAGDLKANTADTVTIALKMQEDAGNKYQGLSIGSDFSVVLMATQDTVEKDSFNNQYDANAKYDVDIWNGKTVTAPVADADGVYHITSAANLVGMMNVTGNSIYKGKTIVLDNNIDLGGRTVKGIGGISDNFAGVFDGQGYTISNFKVDSTENSFYAGLFNQVSHGGTIKNLTVKNATIVGNSMVGAVASSLDDAAVIDNCKAIDCTLIGVKKVGAVVGYSAGSTVTNNYAENCTVIYSEKEGDEILGYKNTGSTVSNNTAKNVSVNQGVAVSSADELFEFANDVNVNGNNYSGKTVILANDIDLGNMTWTPIGQTVATEFRGTFDGQGYTIKNLKVDSSAQTGEYYSSGLFGWAESHVTIRNVKIDGATVTGHHNVAALVGYTYSAKITNCHVSNATIVCTHANDKACGDKAGVLAGYAGDESRFTNCSATGCTVKAGRDAGQLIGCGYGVSLVEGCTASNVTVTATGDCAEEKNINNALIGRKMN